MPAARVVRSAAADAVGSSFRRMTRAGGAGRRRRGGKPCGMTGSIERTFWRRLTMARRVAVICVLTLALAASARAQSGSSGTSTGQSHNRQPRLRPRRPAEETRPATTTFNGDTGLWFVPTAEVLGKGQWSASVYRRGTNWVQGYTNVADFAGTFAYGIGDRAEVFGSFLVDTRIDRDIRPIFGTDPAFGELHRSLPEGEPGLDRRQRRRPVRRRQVQLPGPSRVRIRRRLRCAA